MTNGRKSENQKFWQDFIEYVNSKLQLYVAEKTKKTCRVTRRFVAIVLVVVVVVACMLQSKPFWIMARAVKEFVDKEGQGQLSAYLSVHLSRMYCG